MILSAWLSIPFLIILFSPGPIGLVRWIFMAPVIWLLWLIYSNLARSCRVYIYTAVSSEEIPALFRRSAAARVLPKITNKIAEVQGEFAMVQSPGEAGELPVADSASPVAPLVETPMPRISRQILLSVVAFSILFLVSAGFAYWYRSAVWNLSAISTAKIYFSVLNASEIGTGIWALMSLFRIRIMSVLRVWVFAGLGLLAVRTYLLVIMLSIIDRQNSVLVQTVSRIGLRYWTGTLDCGLSLIIGMASLICLLMSWQDDRQVSIQTDGGTLSSL
jgi:hypothetical protein